MLLLATVSIAKSIQTRQTYGYGVGEEHSVYNVLLDEHGQGRAKHGVEEEFDAIVGLSSVGQSVVRVSARPWCHWV
jgi:hypothetical protein